MENFSSMSHEENTLCKINCEDLYPEEVNHGFPSEDEYENVQNNSTQNFKERHTLIKSSDFRNEFSVKAYECPKVILDGNTSPEKRYLIINLLKDATFGQGKERLTALEEYGFYGLPKGKKKINRISFYFGSGVWLEVHSDGYNLHMVLVNDSIDNRCRKRDGLFCHYSSGAKTHP